MQFVSKIQSGFLSAGVRGFLGRVPVGKDTLIMSQKHALAKVSVQRRLVLVLASSFRTSKLATLQSRRLFSSSIRVTHS